MGIEKSKLPKWINEINNKINNPIKQFQEGIKEMSKNINKMQEYEAKKQAQPFIANDLTKELIDKQTPKWINYLMLVITFLILILTIYNLISK